MTDPLPTQARARDAWRRFVDDLEPLRPELYRYCRYLARSPWDAEDLVQDALARGFVTLACGTQPVANPRAWLFRVASNLWLNRVRHQRLEHGTVAGEPAVAVDPRGPREAAGTLLAQLSPQERAAVVLKDVFDLSLEEIATTLSTTAGAVKAALHRGRGKLVEPDPPEPRTVERAVLDEVCAAFGARDLERLTALLVDDVALEYPGLIVEYGRDATTLRGAMFGCEDAGALPASRVEVRVHRDEPILVCWWGEVVRSLIRVETDGGRVTRMRTYHHAPDVLAEVCRELALPYETSGYNVGSTP